MKHKNIIESAGGTFVGIQKMYGSRPDQVLFQAGPGGSTLAVDADNLTPDAIRRKISEARQ